PDFAKMAEATGVLGLTAETPDHVRPMITRALQHDGPALVEVLVHRQELAMPPTITFEQMTGFSLFMLKAVLSGRGDEIVDLAKINLFREVTATIGVKRRREEERNTRMATQQQIKQSGWAGVLRGMDLLNRQ